MDTEQANFFGENKIEQPRKDDIMREKDETLKAKIEEAETLYQINNQARSQISEKIMERKMDQMRVTSEFKYQAYPHLRSYRNSLDCKNREIKRLQCALYDLDGPKQVPQLHHRMRHSCYTRVKERQLVREIKEAETTARENLGADAAATIITITDHLSSKEDIEDRIKRQTPEECFWSLEQVEYLQREMEAIENDIRSMQTQLAALNQNKSHAYRSILELKKQRDR